MSQKNTLPGGMAPMMGGDTSPVSGAFGLMGGNPFLNGGSPGGGTRTLPPWLNGLLGPSSDANGGPPKNPFHTLPLQVPFKGTGGLNPSASNPASPFMRASRNNVMVPFQNSTLSMRPIGPQIFKFQF